MDIITAGSTNIDIENFCKTQEIFFVGEGNWSFTNAFLEWRGNSDYVISSKLCEEDKDEYSNRINNTYKHIIMYGIDATRLGDHYRCYNIWFQCPWQYKGTSDLLKKFLDCAHRVQDPGKYVFIGICKMPRYYQQYKIDELKNHPEYDFITENNAIVTEMLERGYYHHSDAGDIHDYIKYFHSTLIFQHKMLNEEDEYIDLTNSDLSDPDLDFDGLNLDDLSNSDLDLDFDGLNLDDLPNSDLDLDFDGLNLNE